MVSLLQVMTERSHGSAHCHAGSEWRMVSPLQLTDVALSYGGLVWLFWAPYFVRRTGLARSLAVLGTIFPGPWSLPPLTRSCPPGSLRVHF